MNPRIRFAALAAAAFLCLPLGAAADDPTPEQLAVRAADLIDMKSLDEAAKAIAQALEKRPKFAPALVQQARIELIRGDESRESLLKASKILWEAIEADQDYAPSHILMGHVSAKIGGQPTDPRTWYFRGTKRRGADEPWLIPYHLEYAEKYDPEHVDKYREQFVNAKAGDPATLFDTHHKLQKSYLMRGEREKADAEYAALQKLQPDNAFIPGDYSRNVMLFFQDFDAGESYARKALAIKDYPHARQSLSLALYGKWVVARRAGRDPAEVKALLRAAQENDPGMRDVPTCALVYPPMRFVTESLQTLDARRDWDLTQHNC